MIEKNPQIDVSPLMPHKPPMRMVEHIVRMDDANETAWVAMTVRKENPFLDKHGRLAPEAMFEIMAQAAAAQHGYNLKRNGQHEELGLLVGIRRGKVYSCPLSGDELIAEVRKETELEKVSAITGKLFRNDRLMAEAQFTVWHGKPENENIP